MECQIIDCAAQGDENGVKELLTTYNYCQDALIEGGLSALHNGHKTIFGLIASTEVLRYKSLYRVISSGNSVLLPLFQECGMDFNFEFDNGDTPLIYAALLHKLDCMSVLIHCGANVDTKLYNGENLCTRLAAEHGNYNDELQLLFDNGADFEKCNADGESPLHIAAYYGHATTLTTLLQFGVQVDKFSIEHECVNESALMIACARQHTSCIRILLLHGANPNLQGYNETFPLLETVSHTHTTTDKMIEHINMLIDGGANVNLCNCMNITPLLTAITQNKIEIVRCLLAHGADMSMQCVFGITPFLRAISSGSVDIAVLLIDNGCCVSVPPPSSLNWQDCSAGQLIAKQLDLDGKKDVPLAMNELFFGSGERIQCDMLSVPHKIATEALEINFKTLKEHARFAIRSHLLNVSKINLFWQTKQLDIPEMLKEYLCFK